jgi:predicted PurR-regulated permease PerM
MTAHMSIERERISYVLYYSAVLLVGYLTFLVVSPFLVPLGWAGVLAVCVYPLYSQLTPKLGRSGGAVLTTVLVLLLIVVPVWLVVSAIIREGGQAVPALQSAVTGRPPDWLTKAWGWLQSHVPELAPNNLMESLSAAGPKNVGALATT